MDRKWDVCHRNMLYVYKCRYWRKYGYYRKPVFSLQSCIHYCRQRIQLHRTTTHSGLALYVITILRAIRKKGIYNISGLSWKLNMSWGHSFQLFFITICDKCNLHTVLDRVLCTFKLSQVRSLFILRNTNIEIRFWFLVRKSTSNDSTKRLRP